MFHGPPGTGKTSLAFAVAGIFKLKIYMVNLNSNSLTEDGLAALFQRLPQKCIVLLEDVDAAGMTASRDSKIDKRTVSNINYLGKGGKDELKVKVENSRAEISLSGLLNVIDGVASQEGRILIMTTNHLENLDPALIRPGRVDLSIGFGRADSATIREIFCRIYKKLDDDMPMIGVDDITDMTGKSDHASSSIRIKKSAKSDGPSVESTPSFDSLCLSEEQLVELAFSFSKQIPASKFTPAEIQGYLLLYRQNPWGAVADVKAWVKDTIDAKQRARGSEIPTLTEVRKRVKRKRGWKRKVYRSEAVEEEKPRSREKIHENEDDECEGKDE
jgi:chaperone BCS1